jgi:hypothetical protein
MLTMVGLAKVPLSLWKARITLATNARVSLHLGFDTLALSYLVQGVRSRIIDTHCLGLGLAPVVVFVLLLALQHRMAQNILTNRDCS